MMSFPLRLRALSAMLAHRGTADASEGVNEWGLTNQPLEFMPPLAPHNAWGWSPRTPVEDERQEEAESAEGVER